MMKLAFVGLVLAIVCAVTVSMHRPETYLYQLDDPVTHPSAAVAPGRYPPYKPESMLTPKLHGWALKLYANVMELPIVGSLLAWKLILDNDYNRLRRFGASVPSADAMYYPYTAPHEEHDELFAEKAQEANHQSLLSETDENLVSLGVRIDPQESEILSKYYLPYKAKAITPVEVIKKTLAAIEKSNSGDQQSVPLKAFVEVHAEEALAAAQASAARYQEGTPLSVLDGVPVAVKVEMGVKGHKLTFGTSFLQDVSDEDAIPVRKLRQAGAIIVGTTNMHEIGLGTTGYNQHYGSARNPHNLKHHTGGSSAGSSAAVAAGLVPLGLSSDGGGSIRIPATLCGNVGLKATFGRIAVSGGGEAWSIVHEGPITRTVADSLIAYSILAPNHKEDSAFNWRHPPLHYHNFGKKDNFKGLRVGVFMGLNNDTRADQLDALNGAIAELKSKGAEIVEVDYPFHDILSRVHALSIVGEMRAAADRWVANLTSFSYAVRGTLALANSMSAADYVAAQVARKWFYHHYKALFRKEKIDVILTAASSQAAPPINLEAEAEGTGELDLALATGLNRHHILGNYIGIPAMVVPRKFSGSAAELKKVQGEVEPSLPVGVQIYADHWREDLLFRVGAALQQRTAPSSSSATNNGNTADYSSDIFS